MTLEQFKQKLAAVSEVTFLKPDGFSIPKHFHITEVGQINKRFIDCGGTVREENVIAMQLWESIDFWHRLEPSKLNAIIELSEKKLGIGNHEIEIEYQSNTVGKYGVEFENGVFKLIATQTACLASDKCGIPTLESVKEKAQACCTPGGGCC
jgi:Family of unknown function (DUF6428)